MSTWNALRCAKCGFTRRICCGLGPTEPEHNFCADCCPQKAKHERDRTDRELGWHRCHHCRQVTLTDTQKSVLRQILERHSLFRPKYKAFFAQAVHAIKAAIGD